MKKNLNLRDHLKSSFIKEQKAVKTKNKELDIQQRLAKAEAAFGEDATEQKSKEQKVAKADKVKVIKDTFTLPETDYKLIDECKNRGLSLQYAVTKSEIIRAGLILLHSLPDNNFIETLKMVTKLKIGRPKH